MPDDDWALGQNEVDVRNEARRTAQRAFQGRPPHGLCGRCGAPYDGVAKHGPRYCSKPGQALHDDLAQAIEHLRRLNETPAINEDAEQRLQESITRTLDEIQRLMDG